MSVLTHLAGELQVEMLDSGTKMLHVADVFEQLVGLDRSEEGMLIVAVDSRGHDVLV